MYKYIFFILVGLMAGCASTNSNEKVLESGKVEMAENGDAQKSSDDSDDKYICKKAAKTGTRLGSSAKVCTKPGQTTQLRDASRRQMEDMQVRSMQNNPRGN